VAVAEPAALDAIAAELAEPPAPPILGGATKPTAFPPVPPVPPEDVATAAAEPVAIEVVACDVATPPVPPAPDEPGGPQTLKHLPGPPLPPVAVAVFDKSVGVVVTADAAPPAPPFGLSVVPFAPWAPLTLTVPAWVGAAPTANRTNGRAVANSSCRANPEQIGFLIPPSRIAFTEAGAKVGRQRKRPMSNCKSLVTFSVLGVTITQLQNVRAAHAGP
jgi:hypothetical protein